MPKKSINVTKHKRSTPRTPAWDGKGAKPGPKPVSVDKHKRKPPK
jgi:hypothetical protein